MSKAYLSIPISALRKAVEYHPETGLLLWKERSADMFLRPGRVPTWNRQFAGKPAFIRPSTGGYTRGVIFGVGVSSHRVAFALHHGRWPTGHIDHINGDRTDNRACNLREVSQEENNRNMGLSRRNKSGCAGVRFYARRGKWQAILQGRHLGYFRSFEEAVAARKAAESEKGFHPNHGLLRPHMPALQALIADADRLRGAA